MVDIAVKIRRRSERRSAAAGEAAELRCDCGSLMARAIADRIELKCRRCKRIVIVAADRARRGWVAFRDKGDGP